VTVHNWRDNACGVARITHAIGTINKMELPHGHIAVASDAPRPTVGVIPGRGGAIGVLPLCVCIVCHNLVRVVFDTLTRVPTEDWQCMCVHGLLFSLSFGWVGQSKETLCDEVVAAVCALPIWSIVWLIGCPNVCGHGEWCRLLVGG